MDTQLRNLSGNSALTKRMKIAFIVGPFPALSETFILNQMTGLLQRGHEVDIYAIHNPQESAVHPCVAEYDLLTRVYYDHTPQDKVERVFKAARVLLRSKRHTGLSKLRALNPLRYGKNAGSLRLICATSPFDRKRNYDVIHCHFGPNGIKAAQLREIGMLSGKIVTAFHGSDISQYPRQQGKNVYKHLFDSDSLFMPISSRWNKQLEDLGCDLAKVVVHPMGIDCQKFAPNRVTHTDQRPLRILTVARLVEKKGIEYGIKAFAKLHAQLPDATYTIAGTGELSAALKQLARRLSLDHSILFTGGISEDQVIDHLRSSDIFLYPSLTAADGDIEGIPVAIMEALACELCVVATAHSGIPELIEDGRNGLLAPERCDQALAERLIELAKTPELRRKLESRARDGILCNYNIDKLNDRLEQIFQSLCVRS